MAKLVLITMTKKLGLATTMMAEKHGLASNKLGAIRMEKKSEMLVRCYEHNFICFSLSHHVSPWSVWFGDLIWRSSLGANEKRSETKLWSLSESIGLIPDRKESLVQLISEMLSLLKKLPCFQNHQNRFTAMNLSKQMRFDFNPKKPEEKDKNFSC